MACPRVTNQLDTACAAYIAGLVDGEGTITLSRIHRNDWRPLVVSISNNELPILRFVLAATGADKLTSKRPSAPRRQLHLSDLEPAGPCTLAADQALPQVLQGKARAADPGQLSRRYAPERQILGRRRCGQRCVRSGASRHSPLVHLLVRFPPPHHPNVRASPRQAGSEATNSRGESTADFSGGLFARA